MSEKFEQLFQKSEEKGLVFKLKKKVKREGKMVECEFVSVAGIELEVNIEGRGTQFLAEEFEDLALDEKTMELLKIYAKAIKLKQAPLIEGSTDIGKSKVLEYLAYQTNNYLIYQSFSGQTDVSELIGKYVPNTEDARKTFERIIFQKNRGSLKSETLAVLKNAESESRGLEVEECKQIASLEGLAFEKIDWIWQDGTVPKAMEYDGGRGCWLYFDELGAAEPQILVKLNRIFARGIKRIEITENGAREVIGGDDFRLIATTNPPSYAGREPFEKDFLRRWVYQNVSNLTEKDFLARMNYVGHGEQKTGVKIEAGKVNLKKSPEIDCLMNEAITMFAFAAQKYMDQIPKEPGEQQFRLQDFTDALRIQEYLRELAGEDLIETLKEAVEFYYLGKIDSEKKDSGGKSVREKIKDILETILREKKVKEKIQEAILKVASPEVLEKQDKFAKRKKELEARIKRLGLKRKATEKGNIETIIATTPEGKEVKFELKEQLEEWREFYKEEGVDWVDLPDEITITAEQAKEVKRLMEELGFDKMIIIPENLADTGGKYEKLTEKMSEGYNETFQSDNFKADGGFAGLKNKSNGLRIIVTKEVKELDGDELFKQTLNKSVDDLEAEDGIFAEKGIRGIDTAAYLVMQREYFKRTGEHLDSKQYTWLTEQRRPGSGRGPHVYWRSVLGHLSFYSDTPDIRRVNLGCRLASSLEVI